MESEQHKIVEEYFTKNAERFLPIFEKYKWVYGSKIPTVKKMVDLMFQLSEIADETGLWGSSGRVIVMKDHTGNKIGYAVHLDLAESEWEF
jgi:hypothetical protein